MADINGNNSGNLLIGTDAADVINGKNGNDLIYGGGGNDTLLGENGNDLLFGGDGNDTVDGGNGTDILSGGDGNDQLAGGNGNDMLSGGAGNDAIDGGSGLDTAVYLRRLDAYQFVRLSDGAIRVTDIDSGDTDTVRNVELFVFTDAVRTVSNLPLAAVLTANDQGGFDIELNNAAVLNESIGSAGVDNVTYGGTDNVALPDNVENITLTGTADIAATGNDGDNTLIGNDGANTLSAGDGNDVVDGGAGNDTLVGGSGAGDDTYIGGVGVDTVVYSSATQGITVDLAAGTATGPEIGNDTLIEIENVVGGSGDDVIRGDTGDNQLFGGDGNDLLTGGLGGNDLFDGGNGLDRVSFVGAANSVNVQLAAGTATIGAFTKTFASIELVRGTNQNDTFDATGFSGTSANAGSDGTFNEFEGLGGNDAITGNGNTRVSYFQAAAGVNVNLATGLAFGMTPDDAAGIGMDNILGGVNAVRGSEFDDELRGSSGNDTLLGGAGNDFLGGGAGSDILSGGAGFDTASYGMASGPITADLVAGTVIAGADTDTLISIEALNGSAFNDILRGNAGDNTLSGNSGNDILIGRAGNDILNGGAGIDIARFFGNRAAYTFAPNTVIGPDGTDTTNGVELLQFDDSYMLGFGLSPINLTGFGLAGGVSLFGRNGVADQLTMGTNANGRLIDLGGGGGALTLGTANESYFLNLANVDTLNGSFGNETVTMASTVTNNMLVDMSFGFGDTLNLGNGDNVVSVRNVENVNAFGGANTVTFVHDDFTAGQSFNLGFSGDGEDALILAGSDSNFNISISGDMTVLGATNSGDEVVNLLNVQGGSTFDLGGGNDTLQLFNDGQFVNVVSVRNVENVTAVGFDSDQIHILGNADAPTTVTAGGGADMVWASGDVDHFRYAMTGDSPYDIPAGGSRDVIFDFDASEDRFVFDGISGTALTWELTNFGGADVVRVDFDGDAVGDNGWDMAIQLNGLTGPLTNSNFDWII